MKQEDENEYRTLCDMDGHLDVDYMTKQKKCEQTDH